MVTSLPVRQKRKGLESHWAAFRSTASLLLWSEAENYLFTLASVLNEKILTLLGYSQSISMQAVNNTLVMCVKVN